MKEFFGGRGKWRLPVILGPKLFFSSGLWYSAVFLYNLAAAVFCVFSRK
jgi:hypothetical protein